MSIEKFDEITGLWNLFYDSYLKFFIVILKTLITKKEKTFELKKENTNQLQEKLYTTIINEVKTKLKLNFLILNFKFIKMTIHQKNSKSTQTQCTLKCF